MFRLVDYLIMRGEIPPMLVACIDGSTRLGGSQYVNSVLHGAFEEHFAEEIVPFLENKFGIRGPHSIAGHSSGGMGALHLASRFPELFDGLISFGGDLYFELTHKNMVADLIDDLQSGKLGNSINHSIKEETHHYALALCAAYSPNLSIPKWKVDFPFDPKTLLFREDIWQRWLSFDPLCWPNERLESLGQLKRIVLSAGDKDNFKLHLGAEALHLRLKALGIKSIHQRPAGDHSLSISQSEAGIRALFEN
jgi:enterochelin esterase family protein